MKSLFLKIFLWFWLAMALLTLVVVIITWSTQSEPVVAQWRLVAEESMAIHSQTAADIYSKDGKEALQKYLNRIQQVSKIRAALFDDNADQIAGRITFNQPEKYIRQALNSNKMEVEFSGDSAFVFKRVRTEKGEFVLAAEMARPRLASLVPSPRTRLLRILSVILTAGLVCYALARYLTSPITKLREATKKISKGDLSARVSPMFGKRRDEITDLGKDFDEMATHIQSLIQSQKQLSSDISHELRSPLARLTVALELARSRAGDDAKTALDRIEREAKLLNEMITQLLVISRLENKAVESKRESFDLSEFLKEVTDDANFEAQSKNRSVELIHSERCFVTGKPELLRSAFENVIRNAVRYTKENSTVEVALNVEKDFARISVKDYGEGVPEHLLKELFRPFFRVASARERQTGGVGLGLTIAERAISSHSGNITANNSKDGGLQIEIKLPVNNS